MMAGVQVFILMYADWDVLAFVKCEFPPLPDVSICTCLEPLTVAAQPASSEGYLWTNAASTPLTASHQHSNA
jgi:hypothetical protein